MSDTDEAKRKALDRQPVTLGGIRMLMDAIHERRQQDSQELGRVFDYFKAQDEKQQSDIEDLRERVKALEAKQRGDE